MPIEAKDAEISNGGTAVLDVSGANAETVVVAGAILSELKINNGGTLRASGVGIGSPADSIGKITVAGDGSRLDAVNGIAIANLGQGELVIEQGGKATSNSLEIGIEVGSHGIMRLNGEGSSWSNIHWTATIGRAGLGELYVENGAVFESSYSLGLGTRPEGIGKLFVSGAGSKVKADGFGIGVGNLGHGEILIEDRGIIDCYQATIGHPSGIVTVSDAGSAWNITDVLSIGLPDGEMIIKNGGSVTNGSATVAGAYWQGPLSNRRGFVTVTGAGSTWKTLATLEVGLYGTGSLKVLDGGKVLAETSILGSQGDSFGHAEVDGSGSEWSTTGKLTVGEKGPAELFVTRGGRVSNDIAVIGVQAQSTSKVLVDGIGSNWVSAGVLTIGQEANAELEISGGAFVSSQGAFVALIGNSTGRVKVHGSGSFWDAGPALSIGYFGGNAEVIVADGGTIAADEIVIGGKSRAEIGVDGILAGSVQLSLGGTLHNDGSVDGDIVVSGGSMLSGSGTFDGLVTIGDGGTFSPGSSPGTVTMSETHWNNGGTYRWELNALASTGGQAGDVLGWDLWNTGELNINGLFTIQIASVGVGDDSGQPAGWSPHQSYEWLIATSENGAFSSLAMLSLDTSEFIGALEGGTFSLGATADGKNLFVNFTAVPEVSSVFLVTVGGIGLALCQRARKRRSARASSTRSSSSYT